MPDPRVEIRPFRDRDDYERMVDYFLGSDEAFLRGMGIDPTKLPSRDEWIEAVLADHALPDGAKDRAYLAWLVDGAPVGHSSLNKIEIGEDARIHLHLWVRDLRKAGLGTLFFRASAEEFLRRFDLKRLYCEPYAENPAPNRAVVKAGFRFVETYRTVPGPWAFEQNVNRYVLERTMRREGAAVRIHYLEIVTEKVEAVCAAYAAANGLTFGAPDAGLGNARTAPLPGGGLVGVRAPLHESETPVVRPYWLVDDIEAALAAAVKEGAEVAHPAMEIPGHGTFAIYVQGGVHHGLWQL